MPRLAPRIFALALVLASVTAGAQAAPAKQPKETVVGVALDSNYVRISDFLPHLRDSLVKTLSKRKDHVRAVGIDAAPQDAIAAAQQKGCQYLLQLSVREMQGVGVGIGPFASSSSGPFGPSSADISPEEARQRQELSWVFVDYRLRSLGNADFEESGTDKVRYADLPIGWDPSSYETTIFHTVTRVALWTVKKLPKK